MSLLYEGELAALTRAHRLRTRSTDPCALLDYASNDYLGLSHDATLLKRACERVRGAGQYGAKASMLVCGYTELHKMLESVLALHSGFEEGILVGSGFLANMALFESLIRRNDTLYLDAHYHASGQMALGSLQGRYQLFRHNDPEHLESLLAQHTQGRAIVAIEGVYSMSGEIASKEFYALAMKYEAILIVDEAHSCGQIGERLLGWFDHFELPPTPLCIKMGTLGKAYGSYGAYILASSHIITYLINRAKPIIYSTALSLMDTAFALEGFLHINKHKAFLQQAIAMQKSLASALHPNLPTLILPLPMPSSKVLMQAQEHLSAMGFAVGAIRPPTVDHPMLRVILRTCMPEHLTRSVLGHLGELVA